MYTGQLSKKILFQTIQSSQTVLLQIIQFSISIVFIHTQLNVKTIIFQIIQFSINIVFFRTQLNIKTILFQKIYLSISTHFSSIRPIDRALSGSTTLDQSGPGSDGNEGVLHTPQSSTLMEPHNQIVYCHLQDTRLLGSYTSAELQSV